MSERLDYELAMSIPGVTAIQLLAIGTAIIIASVAVTIMIGCLA